MQGAMGQSVKSFVMRALSNNQEKGEIALRNVSESEAAIIKEKTGIDVAGYTHVMNGDDIRHIRNKHGEGKEKQANQIGLSSEDIAAIPSIINEPDSIKRGNPSRSGDDTILYLKTDEKGVNYVVEVVKTKGKKLEIKTMWKQHIP